MSILIHGKMPKQKSIFIEITPNGGVNEIINPFLSVSIGLATEIPPHGRLIDADALRRAMYHEAFETDSPMQKWDSGCWIRYKLFERIEEAAPTIIPADGGDT